MITGAATLFCHRLLCAAAPLLAGGGWVGAGATHPPPGGTYREKVKLVDGQSVAESLERQKHVDFSNVRIDGETTAHPLSALSADQILQAEATKVPTPDLDADAIGGLLQLTSRRAFEQKQPTVRGTTAGSYDPLVGEVMPDASLTYGRAVGPRRQAGFLATVQSRLNQDRDEEIELGWTAGTSEPDRFEVRDEDGVASEMNFNGSVDWRWTESTMLFLRMETQLASESVRSRRLGWDLRDTTRGASAHDSTFRGARLSRTVEDLRTRDRGWTLSAGLNHQRANGRADLRFTHRSMLHRVLDEHIHEFGERELPPVRYGRAEAEFPRVTSTEGGAPGDPERQSLERLQVNHGSEHSSESVVVFDLERIPFERVRAARLKLGLKARLQHTNHAPRFESYEPVDAAARSLWFDSLQRPDPILEGRYVLRGFPQRDQLRAQVANSPERLRLLEGQTVSDTDPANFDVRQNIFAGYAMAGWTLGRTRLLAGARVEHTVAKFHGHEVAFDEHGRYESTRGIAAVNRTTHVFPGIHLSRTLDPRLRAFASWTLSLRRPDYVDQVPARRISRADREIDEGNAALRPAIYTNYDAAIEYAYAQSGQLGVEFYHRDIRNPTLARRAVLATGEYAGFERTRPENGAGANLQGVELTWQQSLEVFSSHLDGLELEINFAYERSRQAVENRPETLPLAERPLTGIAVQLSYERGGNLISVEFDHVGRSLDAIGPESSEDRYIPGASTWAISLSRKLQDGLHVFLDAENITATPERSYIGDPSRPDEYALDLREYRFGVRWEL